MMSIPLFLSFPSLSTFPSSFLPVKPTRYVNFYNNRNYGVSKTS